MKARDVVSASHLAYVPGRRRATAPGRIPTNPLISLPHHGRGARACSIKMAPAMTSGTQPPWGTLTRLDPKKARSNTRKDTVTRSEEGRLAGEAPVDRFDSLQPQA